MRRALLALTLVAAGCTPMAYTRPGVTAEQAEVEERECRSLAARESFFNYPYPYLGYPHHRRHRGGGAFLDRMMSESNLSDFCMRSRGYSLQPVPPNPF
ncbi:MAG: hypothetical protein FJX60_00400 [Alphaproteobacteria bacterium]|nr:hypothetical protein [Alphaproteobacteria bacterium]